MKENSGNKKAFKWFNQLIYIHGRRTITFFTVDTIVQSKIQDLSHQFTLVFFFYYIQDHTWIAQRNLLGYLSGALFQVHALRPLKELPSSIHSQMRLCSHGTKICSLRFHGYLYWSEWFLYLSILCCVFFIYNWKSNQPCGDYKMLIASTMFIP